MGVQKKTSELLSKLKEKEYLEQRLSQTNKTIASKTIELYDSMFEENIDKISIEGIEFKPIEERDFSLSGKEENMRWDECEDWFEWLKTIGEDGLIKVKRTVAWNTRKKFLKDYVDNEGILPEWIKEKYFNTITWNKSAVKRLVAADVQAQT
jgi:hypothetical protein